MRLEFSDQQKAEAKRLIATGSLNPEEHRKNLFILTGNLIKPLHNLCSALHRKDFPVKINLGEFRLTHNDCERHWSLKDGYTTLYFTEEDVDGTWHSGEGEGIFEYWRDWQPDYLRFSIKRFYRSAIEKNELKSLECANL